MFDIIFRFIVMYVRTLNYISAVILICLNENETRPWCLIYLVCKYSEEDCSSRGEMTDVIKYAAVCRITGLASLRPREITLSSLTREVQTTEQVRNLCTWYWVIPEYFPNLLGTLDCDGNADSNRSGGKSSLDIFFQVISVEKLMFHRSNRCLGCVGYVYVGRIYQNRGWTLLG